MTEPKRLTDEDLAAIEQRAERATPGPWKEDITRLIAEVRRLHELVNQYEALAFLSKKMAEGAE